MSTFLTHCQTFARDTGLSSPVTVVAQTGETRLVVDMVAAADIEIQNLWQDWDFLSSEANTPYSKALTIGDNTESKPSDVGTWDENSFYLDYATDDFAQLDFLEYNDWRRNYRNGVQTNDIPTRIVFTKNNDLIVWPTPDAAYTLTGEYWLRPTAMAANTTISPIPEQFHRIIILKAKMFYGEQFDAPEVFDAASMEYGILINQLESHSLPDQGGRTRARGQDITVVPQ